MQQKPIFYLIIRYIASGMTIFLMSISYCHSANITSPLETTVIVPATFTHFKNHDVPQNLHDIYISNKASSIDKTTLPYKQLEYLFLKPYDSEFQPFTINSPVSAENKQSTNLSISNINNLLLLIMTIVLIFVNVFKQNLKLIKNGVEKPKFSENNLNSTIHQTIDTIGSDTSPHFCPDNNSSHLDNVLNYGCNTLNCAAGFIVAINQTNDLVEIKHLFSRDPTQLRSNTTVRPDKSIFKDIFQDSKNLKMENLSASEKMVIADINVNAYIGTKLFVQNNFYGLLCFVKSASGSRFSSSDLESFMLMTYWISDLLESEIRINKIESEKENATKTNTAKSSFLANMSHEIRTPLTAITGYSEMLLEDIHEASPAQCIDDIHRIQKASKHLLSIINNILDLSKIEAGKITVHLDTIDIGFLVNDVLQFSQTLAAKNNNKILSELPSTPLIITTDGTMIRQCILNLISNACKFTKDGNITITVSEQHIPTIGIANQNGTCRWIYISVKDTGMGISEKSIGKLFKDFSQVDGVCGSSYGGSGLGLAISERMCKLLSGEITVESELNKGSIFTIKIPNLHHPRLV